MHNESEHPHSPDRLRNADQEREIRHLVNRLRLEFSTLAQRELEQAALIASDAVGIFASREKIMQHAREILHKTRCEQEEAGIASQATHVGDR